MSEINVDEEMETKEDGNFSNSAEGSSDDEDADDEKIALKQKEVVDNPYTYDLHVQLISLCRKSGDLEKLRSAREEMNALFPLTPELWLDWLTDERKLATTKEQQKDMTTLFKRALSDYNSISIWLEFVQFCIGTMSENWDSDGMNIVRENFEKAVTSVGIHVAQGCLIWEAYREFENVYLMFLKGKEVSDEEIEEQEKKIYNLFKRQLSIPLLNMHRTYIEFTEFKFEKFKPDDLSKDHAYKTALNKLKQIQPYEDALYNSEPPHYEEYKKYIQFEKDGKEPCRVQSLYERAVIDNCLKEDLWLDYVKYMSQVIKIEDMALPVHKKSVRNIPWCVQLWISYVRSLERYKKHHQLIIEVFEKAISMGFPKNEDFKEFWLAYLSYLRRKIDRDRSKSKEYTEDFTEITNVYNRASLQMQKYCYGSECEYSIMRFWISFTANYKKDIPGSRLLWKRLIDHGHKEEARVWLDYVNFERLNGNATHYRKLLLQAISRVSDWQETFVDLLLAFEQEEGTLETLEKAIIKCETQMLHVIEKRMKKLEETASCEKEKKQDKRKNTPKYQVRGSNNKPSFKKGDSETYVQMDAEGFKIPPVPNKSSSTSNSKQDSHDSESEKRKRPSSSEVFDEAQESKKRKVETSDSHGLSVKHDSSKDDRTVFISNLSFKIEEDKIREFFSQIGELEEVRLVKDFKGRSKGFCYVVYKSQEHAKLALLKDRELLDGRPVLISPCEDKKNNPIPQSKFKFGTGLERNKLFVKGLPFSTTKEDLENMFKEYGPLKEVRIVTYRNGHSKGLAYVEFVDETAAANAIVKTDGAQVEDKIISVAISNPPPRKPKREFSSVTFADSLGGGVGSARGPRGRGRTQLSMLPRSVVRPPSVKATSASNGTVQNGRSSEPMDSSEEKKSLSNSDFAKQIADLLKK